MRSDQLTTDQLLALRERIAPMLEYMAQLEKRMHERKFRADDPLFVLVAECRNCVQGVYVELGHHSPEPLVGKSARPPKSIMPINGDPLGRKPRK